MKKQTGNSGLKIIEGRHQPGPRFEARTFVPEVIYEHRVRDKHRIIYLYDPKTFTFFHSRILIIVAELCMALTVASRHSLPKAPVRLHKATPELLTANYSLLTFYV